MRDGRRVGRGGQGGTWRAPGLGRAVRPGQVCATPVASADPRGSCRSGRGPQRATAHGVCRRGGHCRQTRGQRLGSSAHSHGWACAAATASHGHQVGTDAPPCCHLPPGTLSVHSSVAFMCPKLREQLCQPVVARPRGQAGAEAPACRPHDPTCCSLGEGRRQASRRARCSWHRLTPVRLGQDSGMLGRALGAHRPKGVLPVTHGPVARVW